MSELEARFETEMIEKVYRTAGRETGYWASYFLRAVKRNGGVTAARRLLQQKALSKGLVKLRAKDRLDLATETLVLASEFAPLFSEEERAIAARRLEEARALSIEREGEAPRPSAAQETTAHPSAAHENGGT